MNEIPIAIDNLAVNGIVDFDADAYVNGTPPRYVGRPRSPQYPPFEQPLPAYPMYPQQLQAPALHNQPHKDEFVNHSDQNWKKTLFGTLLAGVAILGAVKHKDKLVSFFKEKIVPIFKEKTAKDLGKEAVKTHLEEAAKETAKSSESKVKSFFSKIFKVPTWAKVIGGSALGLLGLVGLYKAAEASHQNRKH